MAFFGLTALGPPNSFAEHLSTSVHLHVFEDRDWSAAFMAAAVNTEVLEHNQLPRMLELLYRGPPPPADVQRFMQHFEAVEPVSLLALLERVACLREEIEQEGERRGAFGRGIAAEHVSAMQLKRKVSLNASSSSTLQQRYCKPITASHEVRVRACRWRVVINGARAVAEVDRVARAHSSATHGLLRQEDVC
jgi:hypothetical protein